MSHFYLGEESLVILHQTVDAEKEKEAETEKNARSLTSNFFWGQPLTSINLFRYLVLRAIFGKDITQEWVHQNGESTSVGALLNINIFYFSIPYTNHIKALHAHTVYMTV